MKTLVMFCLFPLLCLGCLSSRTPPAEPANEEVHVAARELLIRLYKGSCYGQCPAYTLEIFQMAMSSCRLDDSFRSIP
ncbi:MAG: hypothetical protein IPJ06_20125 [Saprospiraceae bacterium]|nr:hypothetical protein [Saprospiraceae bacterium]